MKIPGVKDLVHGGISGILAGATDIIAKFKADPTKVIEAETDIQKLKILGAQKSEEIALQVEQETTKRIESENKAITDRWTADMASDSWLSKNTRPLVMLSLLGFLFLMIIFDSAIKEGFEIKEEYVDLLKYAIDITIVAYFGGRSAEKFKSIHEGSKVARK